MSESNPESFPSKQARYQLGPIPLLSHLSPWLSTHRNSRPVRPLSARRRPSVVAILYTAHMAARRPVFLACAARTPPLAGWVGKEMLGKNIFDWTIMGGATIIPRSLKIRGTNKFFKTGQNFFIFKIIYDLLIFANNRFSKIQSINSRRDDFMCQSWA